LFAGGAIALLAPCASGQTTRTWSGANAASNCVSSSGSAWATGNNWCGGVFAGLTTAGTNDIAQFTGAGTTASIGLNFSNLGTPFNLGTIQATSASGARTFGSNASTVGVLVLNGTGANSLVLDNQSSGLMTVQPGTSSAMSLLLTAANSTINAGSAVTVSANIGESPAGRAITKTGAGILTLSGTNAYTGSTTVSTGSLTVASASYATVVGNSSAIVLSSGAVLNLSGSTAVTIASGQTLSGTGTVTHASTSANLTNNSIITPGGASTAGTLTITNKLTNGATGDIRIELGGTAPGQYDVMSIGGAYTAGGTVTVSLINSYTPVAGASFQIFQGAGTRTGAQTFNLPALSAGLSWDTSSFNTTGTIAVFCVAPPTGTTSYNGITGSPITISASVNPGETVDWYTGSCGGTLVAMGQPSYTIPSVAAGATTYYALGRNTTSGCTSNSCLAVSVFGGSTVVISQIYGGGGNSGSVYTNDFIELYNRGSSAQSLSGWSVQYAADTGTSWQVTALPNVSLQPGQYFLIQEAAGGGGTLALPSPDVTSGTISMSASAGKVALVNTVTALTVSCPTDSSIVDFVGYGSTANCFEGSGKATYSTDVSTSTQRLNWGVVDTNQNAADFNATTAIPRNTQSTGTLPAATVATFTGTASVSSQTRSLRGFALSSDGAYGYGGFIQGTGAGTCAVRKVRLSDGATVASSTTFVQPKGVATDDQGGVYATLSNSSGSTVQTFRCFDADLNTLSTPNCVATPVNSQLCGMATWKSGSTYYLYVAHNKGKSIIERWIVRDGGSITPSAPVRDTSFGNDLSLHVIDLQTIAGGIYPSAYPNGIAVDSDGTLYIAGGILNSSLTRGDGVIKISPDLSTVSEVYVPGAMDIALYDGHAYVATYLGSCSSGFAVLDKASLAVTRMVNTGVTRIYNADVDNGFSGIDITQNGTIYIGDQVYDQEPPNSTLYDRFLATSLPIITQQPTPQSSCSGGSATFTVMATGSSLSYQWRHGTTNITDDARHSGSNTATLVINPVLPADAFPDYNVVVSNAGGSQTSNSVALTANPAFNATVELQGVSAGPFMRCITFDFYTSPTCTPPAYTIEQQLTFTNGVATTSISTVPCGNYTGLGIRDRLHTLRRVGTAAPAFDTSDTSHLVAAFTTANGKALLGGNVNDDAYVDILDFGGYIGRLSQNQGADTDCSTPSIHADFSGNGTVGTEDFTFIQSNFLVARDLDPCGGSLAGAPPILDISVADLVARGEWDAARGDLNLDGRLNSADVAFMAANGLPACRADFNHIGGVNVQDVLDFVRLWLDGHPAADINNDHQVSTQDIFDFLNLWFAGC
jgi:autotransporter-associated beta strand protein